MVKINDNDDPLSWKADLANFVEANEKASKILKENTDPFMEICNSCQSKLNEFKTVNDCPHMDMCMRSYFIGHHDGIIQEGSGELIYRGGDEEASEKKYDRSL